MAMTNLQPTTTGEGLGAEERMLVGVGVAGMLGALALAVYVSEVGAYVAPAGDLRTPLAGMAVLALMALSTVAFLPMQAMSPAAKAAWWSLFVPTVAYIYAVVPMANMLGHGSLQAWIAA